MSGLCLVEREIATPGLYQVERETAAKSSARSIITGWTKFPLYEPNRPAFLNKTKFNPSIRLGKITSIKHLSLYLL